MEKYYSNTEMIQWLDDWIIEETSAALLGVLATIDGGAPISRTIVVRELRDEGPLFFTQLGSAKVAQLSKNANAALTLTLIHHRREITFLGEVEPIAPVSNDSYWQSYPENAKMRFLVYGPRSGEAISGNQELDHQVVALQKQLSGQAIERPESYVGYLLRPMQLRLYQLNEDRLSDSYLATKCSESWRVVRRVP